MLGVIFAIIAGTAMSLQGVFNTRLSEKIGLFESNVFVQTLRRKCLADNVHLSLHDMLK